MTDGVLLILWHAAPTEIMHRNVKFSYIAITGQTDTHKIYLKGPKPASYHT
jgi:hypothetical protein